MSTTTLDRPAAAGTKTRTLDEFNRAVSIWSNQFAPELRGTAFTIGSRMGAGHSSFKIAWASLLSMYADFHDDVPVLTTFRNRARAWAETGGLMITRTYCEADTTGKRGGKRFGSDDSSIFTVDFSVVIQARTSYTGKRGRPVKEYHAVTWDFWGALDAAMTDDHGEPTIATLPMDGHCTAIGRPLHPYSSFTLLSTSSTDSSIYSSEFPVVTTLDKDLEAEDLKTGNLEAENLETPTREIENPGQDFLAPGSISGSLATFPVLGEARIPAQATPKVRNVRSKTPLVQGEARPALVDVPAAPVVTDVPAPDVPAHQLGGDAREATMRAAAERYRARWVAARCMGDFDRSVTSRVRISGMTPDRLLRELADLIETYESRRVPMTA
jgi:hypothetical protein